MVSHLKDIPPQIFKEILVYLDSESVQGMSETEQYYIWTELVSLSRTHKKFPDSSWSLIPELIENIDSLAEKLAPDDPRIRYQYLFDSYNNELFEEKGNYQEQQQKLSEQRDVSIRIILEKYSVVDVIKFAEKVKFPSNVGFSFGKISKTDIDHNILPILLINKDNKISQFVAGFVSGRYISMNWEWADNIDFSSWSQEDIAQLFAHHPFVTETWKRASNILGDNEIAYWRVTQVNPYGPERDLNIAIEKLLEYGRPIAAIDCIYALFNDTKILDKEQTIKALNNAIFSNETQHQTIMHETVELITALQNDPDTSQDELFKIEFEYLPLLENDFKASPKLLESRLASDPDFFCEAIQIFYRSKNEDRKKKELTEQEQALARSLRKLIYHWKGLDVDEVERRLVYDGPDVQLFSGHSYGYIFELDEPVPTLPTTNDFKDVPNMTISSVIYYGAAGD